jgi:hypothetical protein
LFWSKKLKRSNDHESKIVDGKKVLKILYDFKVRLSTDADAGYLHSNPQIVCDHKLTPVSGQKINLYLAGYYPWMEKYLQVTDFRCPKSAAGTYTNLSQYHY